MQLDDADRRSRQLFEAVDNHNSRERAASQPRPIDPFPTTAAYSLLQQHSLLAQQQSSPWMQPRIIPSLTRTTAAATSFPVPTRSSSFSGPPTSQDRFHHPTGSTLLSAMRDNPRFASTFEDDENEPLSSDDTFSAIFDDNRPVNGRLLHPDTTRSRSQSLLAPPPASVDYLRSWQRDPHPVRFRYNSAVDPAFLSAGSSSSPTAIPGRGHTVSNDMSNISPFTRDIHQILSNAAAGNGFIGARDDPTGGASGTTSRRHSVSYYQPRRDVGFQAQVGVTVNNNNNDDNASVLLTPQYHTNVLSDEELASDLTMLNRNMDALSVSTGGQHSQPSSLPNFPQGRGLLSQSPDPSTSRYLPVRTPSYTTTTHHHHHFDSTSDRATSASPRSDAPASNPFAMPPHLQTDFTTTTTSPPTRYGFGNTAAAAAAMGSSPGGGGFGARPYNGPTSPPLSSPLSPGAPRPSFTPQQPSTSPYLSSTASLAEVGKGVPLHAVPPTCPLYIVEFKAGRTDLFYTQDRQMGIRTGDLVIVEADRGKDLGKVINDSITLAEVEAFQKTQAEKVAAMQQQQVVIGGGGTGNPLDGPLPPAPVKRDIHPKQIYGKAGAQDTQMLSNKLQDELKALQLCQSKVRAKKLPMEVIDAEYQWDRRKLTFYFVAEKRIDFRELVRELFRLYKTRIWMASLQGPQE